MRLALLPLFLLLAGGVSVADEATIVEQLAYSIGEIRSSIGQWAVTTEFLNEDGSVARSVEGTYEFSWVVPERVAIGKNTMPQLDAASGILFYVNEVDGIIEMVSVGQDGRLWIMTGPLGGDTRYTQEFKRPDGSKGQLRFIRYNVAADSFESRMEFSHDGGETWLPGNHQLFTRIK